MKASTAALSALIALAPISAKAQVTDQYSSPAPSPFNGSAALLTLKAGQIKLTGIYKCDMGVLNLHGSDRADFAVTQSIDTATISYNAYQVGIGPPQILYSKTVTVPASVNNPASAKGDTNANFLNDVNWDNWSLESDTSLPGGGITGIANTYPAPSPIAWASYDITIKAHWVEQCSTTECGKYVFTGTSQLVWHVVK